MTGRMPTMKRAKPNLYLCGKQHLHRYAAEFEFRYSNRIGNGVTDRARADKALHGIVGKRVLYRDSSLA